MNQDYLMKAKSNLKKYDKLNNYKAMAFSPSSFIKHMSAKFNITEAELRNAVKLNKIRIYVS